VATECSWNDGSKTQYYVVILDWLLGRSGGLERAPEWHVRGPLTHIDVQHYFIKEHTKLGDITFQYTPTTEDIANILTKALPQDMLYKFICRMGLNPRVANMSVQEECKGTAYSSLDNLVWVSII